MPQPNGTPTSDAPAPPRDWFLPAIESDGSVAHCLDAVFAELTGRAAFVSALSSCLRGESNAGTDAVTELSQRLRGLENTLRFRLGILRPDRPAAWFRTPAATNAGPFQSSLLAEPVFGPYPPGDAARIRAGLEAAWREQRADALPFDDASSCLWRTLLTCRARQAQIARLPTPFAGLRLDELPDGLPPALESRALRAFLLNVRGEMLAVSDRLAACYAQLHATCAKLWDLQAEQERQTPPRQRPTNHAASDMRAELRRRRDQRRTFLAPADIEALRFMGFEEAPSSADLRQRYLEMAKRLHPDRQQGSDAEFKALVNAYNRLTERLGPA